MLFWKRAIELPQTFYDAVGDCYLLSLNAAQTAQRLGFRDTFDGGRVLKKSSGMTFEQAYNLLDRVEESFVRLGKLLDQFPIKSHSQFELRKEMCESSIQTCQQQKDAIIEIPEHGLPISQYGGTIKGENAAQFEHLIICSVEWLGVEHVMAFKLMAKCANIRWEDFVHSSAQKLKDSADGRLALFEATA